MAFKLKCFFMILALAAAGAKGALAYGENDRTVNRDVLGRIVYPEKLFAEPPHAKFTPKYSNSAPGNDHPGANAGQDWETGAWNKNWTVDGTVQKFFQAGIFEKRDMRNGKTPVLVVGPKFYELSDLDRRRVLKLIADQTKVFKQGYGLIELSDWSTGEMIGAYTPKGMFLK